MQPRSAFACAEYIGFADGEKQILNEEELQNCNEDGGTNGDA